MVHSTIIVIEVWEQINNFWPLVIKFLNSKSGGESACLKNTHNINLHQLLAIEIGNQSITFLVPKFVENKY